MDNTVCVDASIALTLVLPHELTSKARDLWKLWLENDIQIVAPPLFFAEVTSVLRERVFFKRILAEEGDEAFLDYINLSIKAVDLPDLQSQAWTLSKRFNRPRAYDAQYLAVASILSCNLWTGDQRLVNAVQQPWVKWAGDYEKT